MSRGESELLTDGECWALFEAFCRPPYQKDHDLIELMWHYSAPKRPILYKLYEEFVAEWHWWQDQALNEEKKLKVKGFDL
jgi:hypothetical protein